MKHARLLKSIVLTTILLIAGCGISPPQFEKDDISLSELMLKHNKERCLRELGQLEYSEELGIRAQKWAESMAKSNRMVHGSLGGSSYMMVGENIAMGYGSVDLALKGWMDSPGHKRNILNSNFTHIGVGYARLKNGRPYWCAQFGKAN